MQLTDEQEVAVKKIKDFLESDEEEFVFIGPAGSGKTFTLQYALKGYAPIDIMTGATISHAAKHVLHESVGDIMKCVTVAQLLGMRPDNQMGKQIFVRDYGNKEPRIGTSLLIVIDECSMVDDKMRDLIYNNMEARAKVIYTGDNRQLPPVSNEDADSSVFKIERKAELTKSQRFSGPIGEVAQFYRSYVDYANQAKDKIDMSNFFSYRPVVETHESKVIFTSDKAYFDQEAVNYFYYFPDTTRMLAYRNVVIDNYNELMREVFRGEGADKFIAGEKIILNAPYKCSGKTNFFLHNGEVVEIEEVIIEEIIIQVKEPLNKTHDYKSTDVKKKFKVYILYVKESEANENTERRKLFALHDDSLRLYNETLNYYKEQAMLTKALWKEYFGFRDKFINYSYMYCQSSHKAQGQTIDHVFVLANDILNVANTSWQTKLKSLYVAATRARKTLYVLMK